MVCVLTVEQKYLELGNRRRWRDEGGWAIDVYSLVPLTPRSFTSNGISLLDVLSEEAVGDIELCDILLALVLG